MIHLFYSSATDWQNLDPAIRFADNLKLNITSSRAVSTIARSVKAPYALLCFDSSAPYLWQGALHRLLDFASSTAAPMVYSDYSLIRDDGYESAVPLTDCTAGSVRDDFNFGRMVLISAPAIKAIADSLNSADYQGAGFYHMRLLLQSHAGLPMHLRETLYSVSVFDSRKSGQQQFDYVDPRNTIIQREMEDVFTDYLKQIGAFIEPPKPCPEAANGTFPCEASIIIPVRNRVDTIADAIFSALDQQASFPFNVIVVDNHSTDGTTQVIERLADPRLVHIIPESTRLGIGGCWNRAIADPRCGRYAVQLDSDDIYSSASTLSTIVEKFRSEGCAMVVGSYTLTDFNLNPLPPGLIDHREWTASNGMNNVLRINGFGAPRAFATAVARRHPMPNVSYGEDYAIGLRLSRDYPIGRIFSSLYLCRRWKGNSDADLSPEQLNTYNAYKDMLREAEILARRNMSAKQKQSGN